MPRASDLLATPAIPAPKEPTGPGPELAAALGPNMVDGANAPLPLPNAPAPPDAIPPGPANAEGAGAPAGMPASPPGRGVVKMPAMILLASLPRGIGGAVFVLAFGCW